MQPVIDHIHITVTDIDRAEQFYDRLLPIFGFELRNKETDTVPENDYKIVEYNHQNFSFGIVNPRKAYETEKISRRKPGALHHIAFSAESHEEVGRLYLQIRDLGAEIVYAPRLYPAYCPDYYAFFFKDSEGNELEIVYFDRRECFKREPFENAIRPITADDRQAVNRFILDHWFSTDIVVRGEAVDATALSGFLASDGKNITGLITYRISMDDCEIMSLDSMTENRGIGTELINKVIDTAKKYGCRRVIVTTTNDDIHAIYFYQRRGFDMERLYRNALDVSRKLKPQIPEKGDYDLPIRHEIEFEYLIQEIPDKG